MPASMPAQPGARQRLAQRRQRDTALGDTRPGAVRLGLDLPTLAAVDDDEPLDPRVVGEDVGAAPEHADRNVQRPGQLPPGAQVLRCRSRARRGPPGRRPAGRCARPAAAPRTGDRRRARLPPRPAAARGARAQRLQAGPAGAGDVAGAQEEQDVAGLGAAAASAAAAPDPPPARRRAPRRRSGPRRRPGGTSRAA